MRYALLVLLTVGCGKSAEQKLREQTACIYVADRGDRTDYYAYEECLWLRYEWSRQAAHDDANRLAALNAKYRADSIRQAKLKRGKK